MRVGGYVGEPSHCDNGESISGCSLCQTNVTLKDCTDTVSCEEERFIFEQGEKVLLWNLTAEIGWRALA